MAITKPKIDITAADYAVVREAFNRTLQLCIDKLSKAEVSLADDILDATMLDDEAPGFDEMFSDTALYSHKVTASGRRKKRAIDRVAPIVERVSDPLRSAIAGRLPAAVYSVFKITPGTEPGIVVAQDLLTDGRVIPIMDNGLATTVGLKEDLTIAGRFVDLGTWHIGFGIATPLRKSEVLAIRMMTTAGDRPGSTVMRDDLHEIIYAAQLHDENLVMTVLEPIIAALAMAIDADLVDGDDLMATLGALAVGEAGDDDDIIDL